MKKFRRLTIAEIDELVKKAEKIRLGAYYFKRAELSSRSQREVFFNKMMFAGGNHNEIELWQLIEKQMPVRNFSVKIAKHAIID